MRISLKTKQVAGVTTLVGLVVIVLSLLHLAKLARVSLEESQSRGELLFHAIFQRASDIVPTSANPYEALREDPGIRSILESAIAYSKNTTYAAILDPQGVAIAHSFPGQEGKVLARQEDLNSLLAKGNLATLEAVYTVRTYEIRQPLLLGGQEFGSIRIGVSTLFIQHELREALAPAATAALVALLIATVGAMLLSHWLLRPIHVIRSGLSRLGRGEAGFTLDLPPDEEFGELGSSFNTLSAQLAAVRTQAVGQTRSLESAVDHLADAIAIFSPEGELLFANTAMRRTLPDAPTTCPIDDLLPAGHPYRDLVQQTIATGRPQGPVSRPITNDTGQEAERFIMTHPIGEADGRQMGVVLLARNLSYLGQLKSTIDYSRKLSALGRLLAGVAHEVKNPLNAMTIHLELLKQKLNAAEGQTAVAVGRTQVARQDARGSAAQASIVNPAADVAVINGAAQPPAAEVSPTMRHVRVIGDEIRRLDRVVQGFLKFTRPEELKLEPINVHALIDEVVHLIEPEAQLARVDVRVDKAADVPPINGDPTMLRQALLNLALNACQAMPNGGTLRLACRAESQQRVLVEVEDTGVGIPAEHLERVFDLYFTTKEQGSGIGLSMVFRTIQLHDGEIEVQSVPDRGSTFRLLLPRA
jgi:signal transduction histidine kinase/HAMP domain-containing protein